MKIGDKVVCVDDSPSYCKCCLGTKCPLILGGVYVVSGVGQTSTAQTFLELIGVKPHYHKVIFGYSTKRFRLLDELKQQASLRSQTTQEITNL